MWPSKLSEYLTVTHAEPFNSFRSRHFRGKEKKKLQITYRKAKKNAKKKGGGGGVDQNGPDCLWLTQANAGRSTVHFLSVCVCVSYSKITL